MTNIKVLKFGGSSLKTEQLRYKVLEIISEELKSNKVVVIVSAIGRYPDPYATDTLISLSDLLKPKQQTDVLSCGELLSSHILCNEALKQNINATCLNIYENGISTSLQYMDSSIIHVNSNEIYKAIKEYDLVIIPGFFGTNSLHQITSLGRGGSDLSAVAIANSLGLNEATIYTDVKGVFSCDPKIYRDAILYKNVNLNQVLTLKLQILQDKACLYALKNHMTIILRSTFENDAYSVVSEDGMKHRYLIKDKDHLILMDENENFINLSAQLSIFDAHKLFVE